MKDKNLPEAINQKDIEIAQPSPMELAQSFLTAGGDLATLKEMMALQREHDAYQAKKAFVRAMAKFKEEPIKIVKDKENKQYNSRYSSIGATVNACLPRMGKCGLSHKWEFAQKDQKIMTGTCTVTHEDGHSDSVSMDSPLDTSGAKNPIQQIKSTRTYIKIETFASLMGLASSETDFDDDGNSGGVKLIDDKQAAQILDMINSIDNFTEESFLSWAKLESITMMPVYDFGKNMNALKAKANAK